jgi:hypothetical protein
MIFSIFNVIYITLFKKHHAIDNNSTVKMRVEFLGIVPGTPFSPYAK